MSCKLDQSVEDNYLYMIYALPTPTPHCSQECVDVESSADVIGKTIPRVYCIGGGVNIFVISILCNHRARLRGCKPVSGECILYSCVHKSVYSDT